MRSGKARLITTTTSTKTTIRDIPQRVPDQSGGSRRATPSGDGARTTRAKQMSEYTPAWFCIRSQPKHEHIAAAHLKREPGIEVYLPRVRFKRATRRGPVWFTEAFFPNYLFARFDLGRSEEHTSELQSLRHL